MLVAAEPPKSPWEAGDFTALPTKPVRWRVGPGETVSAVVMFAASGVGVFESNLTFGVVGATRSYTVPVKGVCTVPSILIDPRNMFMNRVKTRADTAVVNRKFVLSRNTYEFGPLVAGRVRSERSVSQLQSHCDKWRITNNGLFPTTITLSIPTSDALAAWLRGGGVGPWEPLPPASTTAASPQPVAGAGSKASKAEKEKAAAEAAAAAAAPPPAETCFTVEPATIESLPPGETVEVSVWALPPDVQQVPSATVAGIVYANAVRIQVKDNPSIVDVPVSCIGTFGALEMRGPWETEAPAAPGGVGMLAAGSAAAAAAAGSLDSARVDKKDAKAAAATPAKGGRVSSAARGAASSIAEPEVPVPTLDFDRQLVGHMEAKTFTLTNTCAVPIVWRLDLSSLSSASLMPAGSGSAGGSSTPASGARGDKGQPAGAAGSDAPTTPIHAFRVSPAEGHIQPGETTSVQVSFGADADVVR
ncbi:hypothetical protein EON62_04055, partial [archaeon]